MYQATARHERHLPHGSVLVIGAGIAGLQASLDLADSGFKVYLIEKSPAIGGKMAQLDKTFPTNDCSMCILGPKMVDVSRHPNIELLTSCEVEEVKGSAGSFEVTIKQNPTYVDIKECNGCGLCFEVCPVKLPSEFNEGIGTRGAIYKPFPQAVPNVATLDREHCTNCSLCELVCGKNAIKRKDEEKRTKINVGSIIAATGYELFNPSALEEYGYGRYANVITNLQFERLLSASGPTGGHIIRPSDGREPRKIAFIQCVGSRDVRYSPYCSQICCMASTKEAIIAREHSLELKSYIFYMDLRAFGKGFQEYVNRAKSEYGVEYIRARPSQINEKDGNLLISYEDTFTGKTEQMEVDLVVLAPALKPAQDSVKIAEILGVEIDDFGYFKSPEHAPFKTLKPGIYINGACQSPKDIPDSVAQASGAASQAETLLSSVRDSLTKKREKVQEKELAKEPRIGVFVCHCGLNIAGVVDVKKVAEYARSLPNVVFATNTIYACADDTQVTIKNAIKEHDLNRLIVAACTPRTHEPLFRSTCGEAGLNPYLFEMSNIREHDSWVHPREPEKATEKAKDLVKMAVAKARLLKPAKGAEVSVTPSALVIGGGAAGLTCALEIARQGFSVHLAERESELGGKNKDMVKQLIEEAREKVAIHTNSEVKEVRGFIGNFEAAINEERIKAGAIVVATGSEEFKPDGNYLYGKNENVLTLGELESNLDGIEYGSIAFIQCVGARDKNYPGCSRVCCIQAVKNAIELKNRKKDVFLLFRDMMSFGKYEEEYRKSQEIGVKYLRYAPENPPKVREENGKLILTVRNPLLGSEVEIKVDKLVLSAPQIPARGTEELQKILKVPRSPNGFFMEAHAKLRPLEFTSDGIYLCGAAQSPKELPLTIAQASGAASRVCALLSKGVIETEAITAVVNEELCISCGRCIEVCPFEAISVNKNEKNENKAWVNDALCKGCGTCASICPNAAITPRNFERAQIIAMIDALAEAVA
ncbi:MAG: CoB--CoM heterodisulfide reductase iron-sulfur subunit A family protein [Euryarchaeota archaeon]|nr:CoB--CoM heterodisulfide reductase iron-sulfur subunit A family protein [Euryarchaeota archaeon]